MPATDNDDLAWLRAARPVLDDALVAPDAAAHVLLDAIVSTGRNEPHATPARARARRRPRVMTVAVASAAAVAIAFGVVAVTSNTGTRHNSPAAAGSTTSGPSVALTDIRTIAERSGTALGASGRAEITFSDEEGPNAGTTDLSFSRQNIAMKIQFAGDHGRPGFTATNKTVDGQFYLYTPGPDGVSRWYHDTNSSGSSVFETDPRTLLAALVPEAAFVTVEHGTVDGVAVTHLRATKLDTLPALNLSLGPIDAREFKTLDLWVDDHDVVRRLDLTTERKVQELDPSTAPLLQKDTTGAITIIDKNGHKTVIAQGGNLNDALKDYPHITRTFEAKYSVRFYDIGAPITITAPAGATDIAAKG